MGGRRDQIGVGREGRFAVEGEVLGLVVLNDAKEGVVIGGAARGNLPQQKVDMARGRDGQSFRGVLRGEGGVVALDGGAGGDARGCSRREMQSHLGLDFQRRTEFDGGGGGAWGGFRRRIGQAYLRK